MKPLVLIPAYSHVDWRLQQVLAAARMPVMHFYGSSDLVKARSVLLSDALRSEHDRFVLIDADMIPTVEQIRMLVESPRLDSDNAVTGAYYTRSHALAFKPRDVGEPFTLPNSSRFVEGWGAGLGFSIVSRASLERASERLPLLHDDKDWWPFCLPQLVSDQEFTAGKVAYCSEDMSFWWNLRQLARVTLWLDTHLAIGHLMTSPVVPKVGVMVDPTRALT
jgi:hypothetical protein